MPPVEALVQALVRFDWAPLLLTQVCDTKSRSELWYRVKWYIDSSKVKCAQSKSGLLEKLCNKQRSNGVSAR